MTDVIREYLVGLGFKIDDASYAKFNANIAKASEVATKLGEVAFTTAVAVQTAVTKVTEQYEDLYYAAQRTQSAASGLAAYQYGARQIGIAVDAARGSIEGFARSIRENPGVEGFLNNLGVATKGRDNLQVMQDFVGRLRSMPFFLAARFGQMAGIDPDTLFMMIQRYSELQTKQADFARRQREAGVDADKLAVDSKIFNNELEKMESNFSILGQRIAINFLPAALAVMKVVSSVVEAMNRADVATHGWAYTIGTIMTSALGAYLAKLLLIMPLLRAMGVVAPAAAAAGAGAAATAGGGALAAGVRYAGAATRFGLRFLGPVGAFLGMTGSAGEGEEEYMRQHPGQFGARQGPGAAVDYVRKFFERLGYDPRSAAGIAANLYAESGLRTNAEGDNKRAYGIAQWHPDRQAAFKKFSGKDIRNSTLDEQLAFVHYELTQGSDALARRAGGLLGNPRSAGDAAAIVSRLYERPANADGEAAKRAALAEQFMRSDIGATTGAQSNVTVNHKTDIVIQGNVDKDVHDKMISEQNDSWSSALRDNLPRTR